MPVKQITTPFGHSIPPTAPHTITFHIPGWDAIAPLRAGDPSVLSRLRSIYPRFGPFFQAHALMGALHTALSLPPTKGCLAFLDPHVFDLARGHVTSPFRGREGRLEEADLGFHVLQIVDTRLYVVSFPVEKTKSVVGIWQHPGFGVGTRLAEVLLKKLSEGEGVKVLEFEEGKVPEATGVEETNDHQRLKERIVGFLDGRHGVTERDVFLAPTGMASIYEVLRASLKMRPGGKVVALGSIFHSTWHIFEESAYLGSGGYKHFADVTSPKFLGEVEEWLKGEQKEGREVALALLEFPSNPILESADLSGLRELATKYNFPLVIDDTIGSFCNIDVFPVADVLVTSLTKSFSGYANVMGGSLLLPPSSPFYTPLHHTLTTLHINQLYSLDAAVLVSNSTDYLSRSAILNRNAAAVASTLADHPVVKRVRYPPYTATLENYTKFMRPATEEFSGVGYGCLLSVDFVSEPVARAFYEAVSLHKSPHLGAHETLVLNFNEVAWGDSKRLKEYHEAFGVGMDQVRVSVGLEEVEVLVDTFKAALEEAGKVAP